MAVPQILTIPAPLRPRPSLKRFKKTNKKIKRAINAKIRVVKRYLNHTARKHYLLTSAYRDLRRAVAQNEDIVVASVATAFILVYACAVIAVDFVVAFSRVTYAVAETTEIDMGLFILALGPTVLVFCALLLALAMNFISIAIMDGANGKVYRSIRSTLRRSLGAASRIASAWFLLGFVHFGRMLVVLLPLYLYVKWFSDIAVLSPQVLIAAGTAGVVWWLTGLLRYSLVPYVALFEPQHLLTEVFGRSRTLMKKQARTYIVTGTLVLAAYLTGLIKLGSYLRDSLGVATNLLFALGILAGLMAANAGMVMLYRKRKLARVI